MKANVAKIPEKKNGAVKLALLTVLTDIAS
jgi:hypothetical protein